MKYALVLLLVVGAFAQEKSRNLDNLYRQSGIPTANQKLDLEACQGQLSGERGQVKLIIQQKDARIAELENALDSAARAREASKNYITALESRQPSAAPIIIQRDTPNLFMPIAPVREPLRCVANTVGSLTSINCR